MHSLCVVRKAGCQCLRRQGVICHLQRLHVTVTPAVAEGCRALNVHSALGYGGACMDYCCSEYNVLCVVECWLLNAVHSALWPASARSDQQVVCGKRYLHVSSHGCAFRGSSVVA
jgi:hypothetical protein